MRVLLKGPAVVAHEATVVTYTLLMIYIYIYTSLYLYIYIFIYMSLCMTTEDGLKLARHLELR